MTDEEYHGIAQMCRNAADGNMIVGSFAAELVGESYPFSKEMSKIVFDGFSDIELGKRFEKWMNSNEA